jgi:hypothetical protein
MSFTRVFHTQRARPTCRARRWNPPHKHHLAYVNNGNNLLKGTEWEENRWR